MKILHILKSLQDDLEYNEGLLHAYDGDDKKVREVLRGNIKDIKARMAPYLSENDNAKTAGNDDVDSISLSCGEDDTNEGPAITCSRESA